MKSTYRIRAATSLIVAALAVTHAPAQDDGKAKLDGARALLEKWVETRRVLSAERRDWALGKEVLEDRIAIVTRELESLRARIAEADRSIGESDRKRDELVAENAAMTAASTSLAETIAGFEKRAVELLARVPDPIRERVRPFSQQIPEPGKDSPLSLGRRFQNLIGVLAELDKFQRDVTVASEIRTLADGARAEVAAVYLGLGRAFYVTANGETAGVGGSSASGWTWGPANQAAAAVRRAIAILKGEQPAAFVPLPVQVR